MNKSKKLYIYATVMIVSFLFAVIACITIVLKNIVSFNSYESSSIYEIETTCTTSETLSTTYSTSTNTLTTSTYTQTSSTTTETSKMITSKYTPNETTTVTTLTDSDQVIAITNYQIVVIPDETTVKSTKAITSTTTTKIETTTYVTTTTTQVVIGNEDVRSSANFVKTFTRGTYYPGWEAYGSTQVYGGSGRLLMDCSIKDDEIKGSVACKYIQEKYGYNYNGVRTIVYLDIPEMPELSGFYFLDDCCGRYDTIDFYFTYKANCPFMNQGVLKTITCYIVPNRSVS